MTRETVLLAGPELARQPDVIEAIERTGHEVLVCPERSEAIRTLREHAVDLVVTDLEPSAPGTRSFLEQAASAAPDASWVVVSDPDADELGIDDVERVERPAARRALAPVVRRIVERKHAEHEHETLTELLSEPYRLGCIASESRAMGAIAGMVTRGARGMRPVLLEGEPGTGKTLLTRVLHCAGTTRDHPYLAARGNRISVPRLLGWRRGAFPGVDGERAGLLESADGGTLCIHDVGSLSREVQGALSDALDTGIIVRSGDSKPREINVRVVATCRTNLRAHVDRHGFRPGLRYRLSGIRLRLPPLRQRMEEIPALAACLVDKHRAKLAPGCRGVSRAALEILSHHEWPGNVRELENVIQHALMRSEGRRIKPEDLPSDLACGLGMRAPPESAGLRAACADFERRHLLRVLARCGYDRKCSAASLGIGLSSLYRKMKEHGIKKRPSRSCR